MLIILGPQSDLGTAVICVVGILAVMWLGEVPLRTMLIVIGVVVALGLVGIFGSSYRRDRLMVFMNPWNDGEGGFGTGFQLIHSLYALSGGGLFGVGLGNSHEKYLYLTQADTDFIFAIIGEELGLVGAAVVIALFLLFLYAGTRIAQSSPDNFGTMVAGGCTIMIAFQAFLNIAMVIGWFPVVGKPLPFISSGGSSLVAMLIMVGIILSVSRGARGADHLRSPTRRSARRARDERCAAALTRRALVVEQGQEVANMLIVLSGGGTAGHINPALALADVLKQRGCEVRFAGTPTGVEARLVREAGIPFTPFEAQGFNRNHPLTLPKAVLTIQKSTTLARRWFDEIQPDAVVGFGGYACIPVARAAEQRGIPVVVHEAELGHGYGQQVPRQARRRRVPHLRARGRGAGRQEPRPGDRQPCARKRVLGHARAGPRALRRAGGRAQMLLVTGGSLGARHLNQAVAALKDELLAYGDLHIVQVTGPKELDAVREQLALSPEQQARWQLLGYTDHMGDAMAAADGRRLARRRHVARRDIGRRASGTARAVPVRHGGPSDHERAGMRGGGAAYLVADADVEGPEFARKLCELIEDEDVRARMAAAARAQKTRDAAGLLADAVMEAARAQR